MNLSLKLNEGNKTVFMVIYLPLSVIIANGESGRTLGKNTQHTTGKRPKITSMEYQSSNRKRYNVCAQRRLRKKDQAR